MGSPDQMPDFYNTPEKPAKAEIILSAREVDSRLDSELFGFGARIVDKMNENEIPVTEENLTELLLQIEKAGQFPGINTPMKKIDFAIEQIKNNSTIDTTLKVPPVGVEKTTTNESDAPIMGKAHFNRF